MALYRYSAAILASLTFASSTWACTLCSCSASATGVSFGAYDPTSSSPKDVSGTVTLNCTGVISLAGTIVIAMSPGNSGDPLVRQMAQGTSHLNYNLYTDSGRTTVWGTGSGGTSTVASPLNGLLVFGQSVPVYGRIPAQQWVTAGAYTDTVIVTITY